MFKIYKGDLKKYREELKDLRTYNSEGKVVRAFYVTQTIPANLHGHGFTVNYVLLEKLSKKLRGFEVSMEIESCSIVSERYLVIKYTNNKGVQGQFRLKELPKLRVPGIKLEPFHLKATVPVKKSS